MSWRLAVEHVTQYEYSGDVLASYNEARISPRRDERQLVLDHRVETRPAVPLLRYIDYFGSEVCAFDVHERHDALVVTGRSLVETPSARELPTTDWSVLRSPGTVDKFHEYLAPSQYVLIDPQVVAAAAPIVANCAPAQAIRAAMAWTSAHLEYVPGATDVSTTSSEALALGRGVCQDFVHVALALLRAAGVPARYASGYLHPNEEAEIGESVAGQSHAWLEAWVGEWCGADPTNGSAVGPRHVLVARGRDYADVVPLKGVFQGPPGVSVDVRVLITRVA